MALDKKISQLPAASTPLAGNESIPALQEGANVLITPDEIVADEAAARAAADSVISGQIGTLSGLNTTTKSNLVAAVNEVNTQKGVDISNLQSELDATQQGAGLGANGNYTANPSTHYLAAATSLKDATEKLDTQAYTNAVDIAGETTSRINGDGNLQVELDATQSGAGLGSDGSYTADNTTNYLTTASNLKDADKKLDTQLKIQADNLAAETTNRTNADTAIQNELNQVETSAGFNADGTYTAPVGSNYLGSATSLKGADVLLDTQVKTNATAITTETTNRTSAVAAVQSELDATQTGAGLNSSGAYVANGSTHYLGSATSLKNADELLDAQVYSNTNALLGGQGYRATSVDTAVTASDYALEVDVTTSVVSITLPLSASRRGKPVWVIDINGMAATHAITITGTGGQQISGTPSKAVNTAYGAACFYPGPTGWVKIV